MNEELTPWFPPDQKPARPGSYQTQFTSRTGHLWFGFSYWNGEKWGTQQRSPGWARDYGQNAALAQQDKQWRGRTKP